MASVAGQEGRLAAGRRVVALLIARIDVRRRRRTGAWAVAHRRRNVRPGGRGIGPAAESAGAVWIADVGRLAAGGLALAVVGGAVRTDAPPQRVDEDGRRAVGFAEAALEELDVEGQPLALELGRGQLDHGVGDAGAILGEY